MGTGSPGTSGTSRDPEGYVRDAVAPGERVVMLSGVAFVPPGAAGAVLRPWRGGYFDGPKQELAAATGKAWSGARDLRIATVEGRGRPPDPTIATTGHVLPTSLGKQVEVRWDAGLDGS